MDSTTVLVNLIIFSTLFGIIYMYLTSRNKERLALIEKGADATVFNTGKKFSFGEVILNIALLAIGIGCGVLVGAMLEQAGLASEVAFTSSIFIFGGLGLLVSIFVNRKLAN
ncbi:Na+/H+-dicarboxylate symporter [Algoriphagus iocasae]|uniref:Na+/H+-dicarboxylate symporter n=1 Tax=Algoriphagus iocasae TaxID=1836499 RepID=A0A841N1C5_9BACT|nr:DUF6249 domain-containing protein [Algoriphagus iocasae]MBB6328748.1 Na+/H+-dicarboxylate symporter [Algoriphagus iocasae]